MEPSSAPEFAKPDTSFEASVCICTYNGAARIGEIIRALDLQTCARDAWEVIVIDNNSADRTGEVAAGLLAASSIRHYKIVQEPVAGLSYARARAAEEAGGGIICFLDDDNVPAANFLAAVIESFSERPRAGVIGGKVLPRWECQPTPLAEAVAPHALAICDLGELPQRVDPTGGGIVGAGMCVRRTLLREIFLETTTAGRNTDRKGSSLMSGGDLVISVVARQKGWECWYIPALQIQHLLPASRMDKVYLRRLFEGIGRGQAATRKFYDWKARNPFTSLAIIVKDGVRWVRGAFVRRRGTRAFHTEVEADLFELNQCLILGRMKEGLARLMTR